MRTSLRSLAATFLVSLSFSSCTLVRRAESVDGRKPAIPVAPAPTPQATLRGDAASMVPRVLLPGAQDRYMSCKVPGPYIALTYDDGPHPKHTPRLLQMLRERNVKVTFFLIGSNVSAYPGLVRQMIADGHEIGNHTQTHKSLTSISQESVARELENCNAALMNAAGYRPQVMRPPGGNGGWNSQADHRVRDFIRQEFGFPVIMWDVDPNDWRPGRRNAQIVSDYLISHARPGSILLAHDIHGTTVDASPRVLDALLAKGYQFVTVSQLINIELGTAQGSQVAVAGPTSFAVGSM